MPGVRGGRARTTLRTTAAAAVLVPALGLSACSPSQPTGTQFSSSATPATAATARPGATAGSSGQRTASDPAPSAAGAEIVAEQWGAARRRAVRTLLEHRFSAVARHDSASWLAPLRGDDHGLRRVQAQVFDRMTRMGATRFRLTGQRETVAPVPVSAGETVEWDVRSSLTYELAGFDSEPRSFDLDLTFKADPNAPGRLVLTGSRPAIRPQPWDLDGLVVGRSPTALVLAVGDRARVDDVVRRARTAASRVSAVWGSARPAVWVAPGTDADAARLLGRTPDGLAGVAAATDGPLTTGQRAGADRIVLVPGAWSSLRPDGRDVVMTHELTHVTVRAATTRPVPLWLSEGFAELVAYQPIDLPEVTVVEPAVKRARAYGLPSSLPADADFEPGADSLPAAYGLSLLALRTLADAYGTQAVVRVYREAAGGLDVPTARLDDREAAVDAALGQVLHASRSTFVTRWQDRIRRLLH